MASQDARAGRISLCLGLGPLVSTARTPSTDLVAHAITSFGAAAGMGDI